MKKPGAEATGFMFDPIVPDWINYVYDAYYGTRNAYDFDADL